MKTMLEILNLSIEFLRKKGVENPRRQAAELISDCIGIAPVELYMQFDRPLNSGELDSCRAALQRRGSGEPLQYIRGEVEFFGARFLVNRNVLIPRQETEILVDMIAEEIAAACKEKPVVLWDVCCGSGCIGISLKKRLPSVEVILSDISSAALDVARKNAALNDVDVTFLEGDLFLPFSGMKADYIVCNPPYVSDAEYANLEIEVRGFEPKIALVAANEGLSFYKRISNQIHSLLNPHGRVWLEIGAAQGKAVMDIFQHVPAKCMQLKADWSSKDRFFFLEIE